MPKKEEDNKKNNTKRIKLFDKIKPKTKLTEKDKKIIKISFNILAIFCIAMYCFALTPKSLQNDTFYTIKIGQLIRNNGIDYKDHFSWHNLEYLYPHWLYDVIMSLIFDFCNGFTGIYISTIILSIILGISIYFANLRICKNGPVSFALTIGQMYLLEDYIAARAQLVTFILFTLTIIFIEKFLEKPKIRYAIALLIIPLVIANVHSAVFPFYFVLYLPYVGEYLLRVIMDLHLLHKSYQWYINLLIKQYNKRLKKANKEYATKFQSILAKLNKKIEKSNEDFDRFVARQNNGRKNPYKIKVERNDNTWKLIIVMVIALFTGLLTPLRDMPYTYTWRIMKGNTAESISEHLPLTLINNKPVLIALTGTIALLAFSKVKIKLRDLLFISGLTLLALMTRRQISMLALFGGFALARMCTDTLVLYDKKGLEELLMYMTTIIGEVLTVILILSMSYAKYKPKMNDKYVNPRSYPVYASEWIKKNLDYENIKLFNDYNYGSYLLYKDIPVFIDSRCDLYTPEFNGEYDKNDKKYYGQDIFSDYMNISTISCYYDTKFDEYKVTHVITKSNSKLNMLISRDDRYNKLYGDNSFTLYERKNKTKEKTDEKNN